MFQMIELVMAAFWPRYAILEFLNRSDDIISLEPG